VALTNEAEFSVVSSIISSLSSGKQDSANSVRDFNSSNILSEVLVLPEVLVLLNQKQNPPARQSQL